MPFPIIAPVRGRESDYLLTKTGRKVFGQSAVYKDVDMRLEINEVHRAGMKMQAVAMMGSYIRKAVRNNAEMFE